MGSRDDITKESGITVPMSNRKTKASAYDEKAIIRMLENGWSYEQIAKYFEVNQNTVSAWINKNDLHKRVKPKPVSSTKLCRTCIYGSRNDTIANKCNYLLITGHSRCKGKPESVCSKYVKGKPLKVKTVLGSKMA